MRHMPVIYTPIEMHAHEVYPHEMHAREMHAHKTHAYDIHAYEMHAYEVHADEVYPYEMHAHGVRAHELQNTSFCGKKIKVPMCPPGLILQALNGWLSAYRRWRGLDYR
jgi:hypothetical protein